MMTRDGIWQGILVMVVVVMFGLVMALPAMASPNDQQDGADSVKVILESPVYDPQIETYLLTIRINEPAKVAAVEIIVDNTELGQTVAASPPISVFDQPTVRYSLSLKGQHAGEYLVKVRAIDHHGNYFERQKQYGSGNPLDLATASIKYAPPQPEKPTFSIISVNPDLDNERLYIRLDVPVEQNVVAYEGYVLDNGGQEIAQFPPTTFPGAVIEETLPEALAEAIVPGEYKLLLFLWSDNGQRSDPEEFGFQFIPPPKPSFSQRIAIALKNHPGVLIGIALIILGLILWLIVKNRKEKQKLTGLPRPPVDRTKLHHAEGAPAAPRTPRSSYSAPPFSPAVDSHERAPSQSSTPIRNTPAKSSATMPSMDTPQQTYTEADVVHRVQVNVIDSPSYMGPKTITISRFPFIIGRSKSDLQFADSQVSRHHLRIDVKDGGLYLMDLDSKNGTFLNGEAMASHKPYPLAMKAAVRLGQNTKLEIIPM